MKKNQIKRMQQALITEAKRLSGERKELTDKLTAIDRRLSHIKRSLEGVRALLSDVPLSQILPPANTAVLSPVDPGSGITSGIRQLFVHNRVLTAPFIREALKNAGMKKDDHRLLIVIHMNLKRLAERGEIRAIRLGHRKVAYERVNPLDRVLGERSANSAGKSKSDEN